ncbi:MAG TPA: phosphoribosylaminoimidazolesuccinocarboxamide synthase [Planctomycetota bacterium]|jgi:phosphoribosylaminoimidazole-succinocarboxamide synthase|nr:phosphoribosylaminoimidazolesuccinocarboxamide synthase [Planctomycetota bacterium]
MSAGVNSSCPTLTLLARGKVRDVYEIDADHLLFVASDRISAFDVVMANGIPGKGKILTQLSLFWFDLLKGVSENHLVTADVAKMPASVQAYRDQLEGRTMLVRRLKILPVEAIVRGYLTGSGLKEYKKTQTVCNIPLPAGLGEASKLAEPLYTPSTKAELGAHDENIHPDQAAKILGANAETVKTLAIKLYSTARDYAATRGIIIADTKFEFGTNKAGKVIVADEVLTPDSSRFWPAKDYKAGVVQNSFDKQYLRDYLEKIKFDKNGKGIELPKDVIDNTLTKYVEAFRLLTGKEPKL